MPPFFRRARRSNIDLVFPQPSSIARSFYRRRQTVAVFDELRQLAPVDIVIDIDIDIDIEPHANPPERALIGWHEESLGIRVNQHLISTTKAHAIS